MSDLAFAILLVLVYAATGRHFLRLFRIDSVTPLEEFLLSIGLGIGIFATAVFILGVTGFAKPLPFLLLLSLGVASAIRQRKFFAELLVRAAEFIKDFPGGCFEKTLAIIALIFLFLNTFVSMAPVWELDALVAHFAIPKLYMEAGTIYEMKGFIYSHFPQLSEMLNLFAMVLKSDVSASIFNSLIGIFTALLVFAGAKRFFGGRTAFYASVMFYCSALVTLEATGSFVEMPLAFFTLLSFYSASLYFSGAGRSRIILSGIFLGFAFQTKYFAVFSFAVILVLFLSAFLAGWKRKKDIFADLPIWVAVTAVAGSPWYLFNLVNTGNPVFPFLYGIFGGKGWSRSLNDIFVLSHKTTLGVERSVVNFLLLPIYLTFKGHLFVNGRLLGLLFMLFIPVSLFDRVHLKRILLLFSLSLVYLLLWFLSSQQTRFIFPLVPFLVVLAALGFIKITDNCSKLPRATAQIALMVFALVSLHLPVIQAARNFSVVTGVETKKNFLERIIWEEPCIEWMNSNLKKTDTVFFAGLAPYYLDIPYIMGQPLTNGMTDFAGISNGDELRAKLKSLGITHVYIFNEYLPVSKLPGWEDLSQNHMEKLYSCGRNVDLFDPSRGIFEDTPRVHTIYRLE